MATPALVQVECPSCHASVKACVVGAGRRLPCPACGHPVLVTDTPVAARPARLMGMDAHLSPSEVAIRPASFPWGAAGIAAACAVGLAWWAFSAQGPTLVPPSWKPIAIGGGMLVVLVAVSVVSWRTAVSLFKIALPIYCVGLVAWKAMGPGGMLETGSRRLAAALPGGATPASTGAEPAVLLELLSQAGIPSGQAMPPADLPPAIVRSGSPVTFVLEGVAGIDVGGTVRRALREHAAGVRPSWSMSTRVSSATVTVWMAGDFDRIATMLPIGRETLRDETTRRVVIEVDPALCVRRR